MLNDPNVRQGPVPGALDHLVFVGLNSRIAALDRYSGGLVWSWKAPKGRGFPAVLLDGDRLIASVQGYTYCLDPLTGQQVWMNPLKGFGLGVSCIASVNGTSLPFSAMAETQAEETRRRSNADGGSG